MALITAQPTAINLAAPAIVPPTGRPALAVPAAAAPPTTLTAPTLAAPTLAAPTLAAPMPAAPTPAAPTYVAPGTDPLALTLTAAEEAAEDAVGDEDEVMPAPRALPLSAEVRCDWACEDAVMTEEQIEVGYCSGRRCKAKMHPECFLRHAGEAAAALDNLTCFCRGCWAKE